MSALRRTAVLRSSLYRDRTTSPLVSRFTRPVEERIAHHPVLDEAITAEFNRGTFVMLNERYPSIERLTDQYFPGFIPRTKDDFQELADRTPGMTLEELMLESIGCWNINMLLREFAAAYASGAKLSTPMQWEVAGISEIIPEYYAAWRSFDRFMRARQYSFWDTESIMASPKYKIGGVVPMMYHQNELTVRRMAIIYPVCHNDFDVYPHVGEERYAQQPLDFLIYSHLNYYHVLLNMYKYMLMQEGGFEPNDRVSMMLVNFALDGDGGVMPKMYMIETDDRVRDALEQRFTGVGPAYDQLSKEWFERKELSEEYNLELATNARDLNEKVAREHNKAMFNEWKRDMKIKDDVFTDYIEQQQRELREDRKSLLFRLKEKAYWAVGGIGPLTRE